MTGHTADISNICEYPWYDRVIFRYQPITYPYFPVILGRYLGPAIDVGSAMTYKILKANGEHVCRTIVCLLKPTKLACSYHKQLRNEFEASVLESLGPADTISGFYYKECTDLTPDIYYYEKFDEDGAEGSPDESPSLTATSEFNDRYLDLYLMIPWGSGKAKGTHDQAGARQLQ